MIADYTQSIMDSLRRSGQATVMLDTLTGTVHRDFLDTDEEYEAKLVARARQRIINAAKREGLKVTTQARHDCVTGSVRKRAYVTEDKVTVYEGDRAYNYYDMKPGVIGRWISTDPEPSGAWFEFIHDDGSHAMLNGQRICSAEYAKRRAFKGAS